MSDQLKTQVKLYHVCFTDGIERFSAEGLSVYVG